MTVGVTLLLVPVLHSHPSVKKRGLGGREGTSSKVVLWCVACVALENLAIYCESRGP